MANLPEEKKWEEVYQWETSDRALGGPGGVMNKPIINLTNRTAYLKEKLEEKTSSATETKAGIVKLNSEINSSSDTEAATPAAVKKAYDLAAGRLNPKSNLSDLEDSSIALQNLGLAELAQSPRFLVTKGENANGWYEIYSDGYKRFGKRWYLSSPLVISAPASGALVTFPISLISELKELFVFEDSNTSSNFEFAQAFGLTLSSFQLGAFEATLGSNPSTLYGSKFAGFYVGGGY